MPRVTVAGADLLLSSVSESEAWLQNFATLYDIVWLLLDAGLRSPVTSRHERVSYLSHAGTSLKFYSVGLSNNAMTSSDIKLNKKTKLQRSKIVVTIGRGAPLPWLVVTMGCDGQQCDRCSPLHSADGRKYNIQHHLHIPSDDTTLAVTAALTYVQCAPYKHLHAAHSLTLSQHSVCLRQILKKLVFISISIFLGKISIFWPIFG